jgi:hypothetical protein
MILVGGTQPLDDTDPAKFTQSKVKQNYVRPVVVDFELQFQSRSHLKGDKQLPQPPNQPSSNRPTRAGN